MAYFSDYPVRRFAVHHFQCKIVYLPYYFVPSDNNNSYRQPINYSLKLFIGVLKFRSAFKHLLFQISLAIAQKPPQNIVDVEGSMPAAANLLKKMGKIAVVTINVCAEFAQS